jgi:hypothetical protein
MTTPNVLKWHSLYAHQEFSTSYPLLAAFLIYRKHRFLRTEMDELGRPLFVFADAAGIALDVQDFESSDPAVPCRTLARILAPLRREATAMRRRHQFRGEK